MRRSTLKLDEKVLWMKQKCKTIVRVPSAVTTESGVCKGRKVDWSFHWSRSTIRAEFMAKIMATRFPQASVLAKVQSRAFYGREYNRGVSTTARNFPVDGSRSKVKHTATLYFCIELLHCGWTLFGWARPEASHKAVSSPQCTQWNLLIYNSPHKS